MKRILLSFILIISTIGMFSQKNTASDDAILQLMNARKGMNAINSATNKIPENIRGQNRIEFKREITILKTNLINTAVKKFKSDYSAKEIDFIYKECTSDIIDYSDLTNGFFRNWRKLKGELFFKNLKQVYSKYK